MLESATPGRRAEPDHRAAEADGVGEIAPVIAALLQRERGERDVVEHGGQEAEAEAVCQEADGSSSTGIIEAQVTSDSRKIVPWNVSGMIFPVGSPQRRGREDHAHTASPITGTMSSTPETSRLAITLARMADQDRRHDQQPASIRSAGRAGASFLIGE